MTTTLVPDSARAEIPAGLCHCGCGKATRLITRRSNRGDFIGMPRRFLKGHLPPEARARQILANLRRGHPLKTDAELASLYRVTRVDGRQELDHRRIAERALGHALPAKAEIHHLNGDRFDNARTNLVICEDHAYHMLLHRRARALAACGNAAWMCCRICKQWDDPANLYIQPTKPSHAYHRACHTVYAQARYRVRQSAAAAGLS